MPEDQWYFSRSGQQFGPMPRAQLDQLFASQQLFPTDVVWTPGMAEWAPVAQVYPVAPYSPGIALNYYQSLEYSGFGRRFAAWFVDQVMLFVVNSAINLPATLKYGSRLSTEPSMDELKLRGTLLLVNFVFAWLYFAVLESSPAQGTLGKLLLGLRVTDLSGARVSFARASGRFFGKILSTLIIFIGFLMAAFTERRQALHDLMAGTLVIRKPRSFD